MKIFGESHKFISEVVTEYESGPISDMISPVNEMCDHSSEATLDHYFRCGRNAVELIVANLLLAAKTEVRSVLDQPCGFGRVTRHIHAAFPNAHLSACDLYDEKIEFCAKTFRADPIESTVQIVDLKLPRKYDLIWCGSMLTHLPRQKFIDTFPRLQQRARNQWYRGGHHPWPFLAVVSRQDCELSGPRYLP